MRRVWAVLTAESSALAHAGLTVLLQLSAALMLREAGVPLAWALSAGGVAAVAFYWMREWQHARGKTGAVGVTWSPLTWHRKSQLDLAGPAVAAAVVATLAWW